MMKKAIIAILGAGLLANSSALAIHYLPERYEIEHWYQSLMMPDRPELSCCGVADAYWADEFEDKDGHYIAIITDDRNVPLRKPIPLGTRIPIPDNKLPNTALQQPNPTGHGIVFMNYGSVYCYFPPVMN